MCFLLNVKAWFPAVVCPPFQPPKSRPKWPVLRRSRPLLGASEKLRNLVWPSFVKTLKTISQKQNAERKRYVFHAFRAAPSLKPMKNDPLFFLLPLNLMKYDRSVLPMPLKLTKYYVFIHRSCGLSYWLNSTPPEQCYHFEKVMARWALTLRCWQCSDNANNRNEITPETRFKVPFN